MEYKRIVIDLSTDRQEEEVSFGGYYTSFMIVNNDEDFEFKINTKNADTLYSDELQGFQGAGVFSKLFITNEAGKGEAVFVVYK